MTQGLEIYYNPSSPFFMNTETWRRAEPNGNANILFYDSRVVRELTALYPLATFAFLKLINRTNKTIIRLDVAGAEHQNPTTFSSDGLNIRNQQGEPRETYEHPPFSLGLLWPDIERYKQIHFNTWGVDDPYTVEASWFGRPYPLKEDVRALRLWYVKNRKGDNRNPTGYSLDISDYMPDYGEWPERLTISPDQDYPDGNLLKNSNFQGSQTSTSWSGVTWPADWQVEFPRNDAGGTNYVPKIVSIAGSNQKAISIRAGYWNGTAGIGDAYEAGLKDWTGVFQRFTGVADWERHSISPSRYHKTYTTFSGVTINTPTTVGVTNVFFDLAEDYFWNIVYKNDSRDNYSLWESDHDGTNTSWFPFNNDGSIDSIYVGSFFRHLLGDPTEDVDYRQYFSKFRYRYREGYVFAGSDKWSGWGYGNISVTEDSPIALIPAAQLALSPDNPAKYFMQAQLGSQGGRGLAYMMKFDKTADPSSLTKIIDDPEILNRRVYPGDLLQYEILVDENSVDNRFFIDVLLDDPAPAPSNQSYVSSLISIPITIKKNEWEKIQIDLTPYAGKVIKRIEFKFVSSNTNIGSCLAYFNEVQFINVLDRFKGRQFFFAARVFTNNLANSNTAYVDRYLPNLKCYMKCKDEQGNVYYKIQDMYVAAAADQNDEDNYFWIKSIIQIPYDSNCIQIGFGVGLFKRNPTVGQQQGYGPSDNGGEIRIERVMLEPTSRLHMLAVYSLDNAALIDDPFGIDNMIPVTSFGWKAWAFQATGKYFEEWSEA